MARKVDLKLVDRGPCKAEVFVVDSLRRELPEGEYRARFTMTAVPFGSKRPDSYQYELTGSRERVEAHWDGFCHTYGYGLFVGREVSYWTGNARRHVKVMRQPKTGARTVLVTGFRYKTTGYCAKPRRLAIGAFDWCGPQKPETSRGYQAAMAADAVAWFCHGVAALAQEAVERRLESARLEARSVVETDTWGHKHVVGGFGFVGAPKGKR